MKKVLYILFFLCFHMYGQLLTIDQVIEKDGLIYEKEKNVVFSGILKKVEEKRVEETEYVNGLKDGLMKVYDDNMLFSVSNYEKGIELGVTIKYFDEKTQVVHKNGDGVALNMINYYPNHRDKLVEYSFGENQFSIEGEIKITHGGQVVAKVMYIDSEAHGITQEYTGKDLIMEGIFRWGELYGEAREYYENGQIKVKSNYTNGQRRGDWELFAEDGTLLEIKTFKQGDD